MIKVILLVVMIVLTISCAPKIIRHGYEITQEQKNNCDIAITQNKEFTEDVTEIISRIEIDDTGFTVNCDEKEIINILKTEGCSMNADVINIIQEKRPDFWSTCYRASAEFIRLNENVNNEPIMSDAKYQESEINKRMIDDRAGRVIRMGVSAVIGLVIGFLI